MPTLEERLYQYVSEERYAVLKADAEFIQARQSRDKAEQKLCASLTKEQTRLFIRYMDEENYLDSIRLRHIFREALGILPALLRLSR